MKKFAIFGVPRCGSSWLSQIFNSHPDVAMRYQPLFSYEHKGKLSEHSSAKEISQFFDEIYKSKDAFVLMSSAIHKNYPSFAKSSLPTHIAFKETRYLHIIPNILERCPDVTIIGIIRNPLATLASWIQTPKEFNPDWDIHEEWRRAPGKNKNRPEEFFGYDKWKETAEEFFRFENLYPDQFKIVRYDQLNAETIKFITGLFEFCGLPMHSQVLEFIVSSKSMHDNDPYSVFRSKTNGDQYRDTLPLDIVTEIRRELNDSILKSFLKEKE